MADATWSQGAGRDDGWGPATSVRSASAGPAPSEAPPARTGRRHERVPARTPRPTNQSRPTNRPRDAAEQPWQAGPQRRSAASSAPTARRARESGLRAWAALLLLVGITVLGILFDGLRHQQLSSGFDLGIIIGSVVAMLAVRRSGMFWVVVSPPIVYSLGAGISLYARSGGLHDRGVLIDAATNWLVYGFPAIAAASAAVLIIAGIRLIMRR